MECGDGIRNSTTFHYMPVECEVSIHTDRISEGVHKRGDEGEGTKEERREG